MVGLRRFLYLDDALLASLISGGLEQGLRTAYEERRSSETSGGAEVGLAGTGGNVGRSSVRESNTQYVDTPEAQFSRLVEALKDTDELRSFLDADDPSLGALRIGSVVELVDWDVDIAHTSQVLARAEGAAEALEALENMRPVAETFGFSMDGVPSSDEVTSIRDALGQITTDRVALVAELEDIRMKATGWLKQDSIRADVEGLATVVGMVSARVKEGQWRPLIPLPGIRLQSREQRRKMERVRPTAAQADSFLEGPALVLDVVAVYR